MSTASPVRCLSSSCSLSIVLSGMCSRRGPDYRACAGSGRQSRPCPLVEPPSSQQPAPKAAEVHSGFAAQPTAVADRQSCCPPTRAVAHVSGARQNIRTRPSRSSMRARIISRRLPWMSIPRRTPRCAIICATANSRRPIWCASKSSSTTSSKSIPIPRDGAFSINLEGARSPFSPEGTYLLKVGLQGKHLADWQRKDASLTFVMDVSGSMQEDNQIEHGEVRPHHAGRSDSAPTIAWRLSPSATMPGSCWNRPRSRIAIASSTPSTACTR